MLASQTNMMPPIDLQTLGVFVSNIVDSRFSCGFEETEKQSQGNRMINNTKLVVFQHANPMPSAS